MSDLPQGPGWWRASDGLYYPPEARPGYTPEPDESGASDPDSQEGTMAGDADEPSPTGVIDDDLYERDWAVEDEAEPESRRLLPLLALVAVAGLMAGVAVWFLLGDNDDPETASTTSTTASTEPDSATTSTTEDRTDTTDEDEVSAFDVAAGDCFDPAEVEESEGLIIRAVRLVDCEEPHRAEVISVETLDIPAGEPFPGAEARDAAAEELCQAPVEEFLGGPLAESTLLLLWLAPSEESWPEDDREVVCMVAAPDGETLTGTVAGTAGAEQAPDDEGEG